RPGPSTRVPPPSSAVENNTVGPRFVKSFTHGRVYPRSARMAPPQDKRPEDPKDPSGMRSAATLLAIPSLLIVSPLVGFFLGDFGDKRFHTSPWLALVGLVLG